MLSATKTALVFTWAAMLIGCGQVPEKKSEDKLDAEVANLERQVKSLQDRLAKTNQRIKDLLLDLGPDVQPVVEGGYRSAPNIIEESSGEHGGFVEKSLRIHREIFGKPTKHH